MIRKQLVDISDYWSQICLCEANKIDIWTILYGTRLFHCHTRILDQNSACVMYLSWIYVSYVKRKTVKCQKPILRMSFRIFLHSIDCAYTCCTNGKHFYKQRAVWWCWLYFLFKSLTKAQVNDSALTRSHVVVISANLDVFNKEYYP